MSQAYCIFFENFEDDEMFQQKWIKGRDMEYRNSTWTLETLKEGAESLNDHGEI